MTQGSVGLVFAIAIAKAKLVILISREKWKNFGNSKNMLTEITMAFGSKMFYPNDK